jgi:hypothetical protein
MSLAESLPPSDTTTDAFLDLLFVHMVEESLREMALPHAMVCRDIETGISVHEGPYPDGFAALCAAEREASNPESAGMTFTVVPLLRARTDEGAPAG